MFGQNAKLAAVLLLFLASAPAFAKKQNLISGSMLGFGFLAGVENRPRTPFATGTQTTSSNYTSYFGFQPFIDLANLAFALKLGWHFYPVANGSGTDGSGNFTESSDGGSFDYGARVLLAPYLNKTLDQRIYFVLGMGQSIVKLKNSRKYSSGSQLDRTNSERVEGTGLELNAGLGYEFFLLQNYSLQLEAGYVQRSVETFNYRSTTDVSGAARSRSDEPLDTAGNKMGFHVWSPYGQIVLNLHL